MALYKLVWKRSAEKELRSLPRGVIARVVQLAEALRTAPHSASGRAHRPVPMAISGYIAAELGGGCRRNGRYS